MEVRRLRVLLAGSLLAVGLAGAPSRADASTHTWNFTAAHNATTTLKVTRAVDVLAPGLANRIALGQDPASKLIDTRGSYGGLVIRDKRGTVVYAVLRYKSFVLLPQWGQWSADEDSVRLPAGTYQVSVLSPGRTTVHLPIKGASDRSVKVNGTASSHGYEYAASGAPVETPSLPLPLKATSTFLAAAWVYSGPMTIPTRYDYQYLCYTGAEESSGTCLNQPGGGAGFLVIAGDAEELIYAGTTTHDMGFKPGPYAAHLERADSMPAKDAGFLTVVLD